MQIFRLGDRVPPDRAARRAMMAEGIKDPGQLLRRAEVAALLDGMLTARTAVGSGGSEVELQMLLRWAEKTRIDEAMREAVNEYTVAIDVDESGEVGFTALIPEALLLNARADAELLLAPYQPLPGGEAAESIVRAFAANRAAQARDLTAKELEVVADWAGTGAANLALLQLLLHFPTATITISPHGGVLVGVAGLLDDAPLIPPTVGD